VDATHIPLYPRPSHFNPNRPANPVILSKEELALHDLSGAAIRGSKTDAWTEDTGGTLDTYFAGHVLLQRVVIPRSSKASVAYLYSDAFNASRSGQTHRERASCSQGSESC
jgi:hypothetical protein